MRGIGEGALVPLYRALEPDDILEFHAARLLILISVCGRSGPIARRIDGRTKLAKLDFFVRYPKFLEVAQRVLSDRGLPSTPFHAEGPERESPMIRYRFGPWDPAYRDYLAFLESRGLLRVVGTRVEAYSLTAQGRAVAEEVARHPTFAPLVARAQSMVGNLASWTGSALKDFIYEV